MGKIILVTGGARSGKSTYAEKLAADLGSNILYIATSIPFDEEMKDRIKKHRESRPKHWDTYEGYRGLGNVIKSMGSKCDGVLLDCITVMITNIMMDYREIDYNKPNFSQMEKVEKAIKQEIAELLEGIKSRDTTVIMVTNELGCGIVPENLLARAFRDIAGRVNQNIAKEADEVYLTVCGIPLRVK